MCSNIPTSYSQIKYRCCGLGCDGARPSAAQFHMRQMPDDIGAVRLRSGQNESDVRAPHSEAPLCVPDTNACSCNGAPLWGAVPHALDAGRFGGSSSTPTVNRFLVFWISQSTAKANRCKGRVWQSEPSVLPASCRQLKLVFGRLGEASIPFSVADTLVPRAWNVPANVYGSDA